MLSVAELTSIADYFILSTVRNQRQAQAAAEEVEEKWNRSANGLCGKKDIGKETGSFWIWRYYRSYFTDEERRHYELDHLWGEAPAKNITMPSRRNCRKFVNDMNAVRPLPWKENSIAEMTVARLAPFGAFLDAGTGNSADDILLHKEQQTNEVRQGDKVRVFLYHDPHHRLTASMRLPQIPINGIGYAEVLLTTRFGAFVEAGTERGIFLPHTETVGTLRAGQKIWVRLYVDKTGRLAVSMKVDEEMRRLAKPCHGIKVGGKITGTVYNMTDQGAFIITRENGSLSVPKDMPADLRMGQEVTGRVTFIREDGHLNISLRPPKEKQWTKTVRCFCIIWNGITDKCRILTKATPKISSSLLGSAKRPSKERPDIFSRKAG